MKAPCEAVVAAVAFTKLNVADEMIVWVTGATVVGNNDDLPESVVFPPVVSVADVAVRANALLVVSLNPGRKLGLAVFVLVSLLRHILRNIPAHGIDHSHQCFQA